MPEVRGRIRRSAVRAGLLLLILVLVLPAPAHAAEPVPGVPGTVQPPEPAVGENIPTYDVVLTIGTDGVLYVRETITYDFDQSGEHGIVRHVPFRRGDRVFDVRNVRTSSSTGAPSRARMTRFLRDVRISVGDRHREVRGRQAYVIEYEVGRAFTPHSDRDELVWDAIGTSWAVPIGNAAVRVEAPVPLRYATCRAGTPGATTRCLRDRDGPYAVDFIQTMLAPHEGMRIRVRLPKHAIAVAPPRYVAPRWTGGWPGTALLALALGAVALVARRPAPRRGVGAGLVSAGLLLIVADAGGEVVASGPWAFSMGDRCLAGLALLIVGAGIMRAPGPDGVIGSGRRPGGSTVGRSRREHIASAGRLRR
ncbi:DUF2207 domain-containing protein [Actinomadura formosensis]|uniref:DUF2207 domain-containing protein n=1 Tax=Actinomadura formosensis TaxID=60706 RepID=UPI0008378519|nr:DUF2207 domain-containing protein [Actinomadura formosensis]